MSQAHRQKLSKWFWRQSLGRTLEGSESCVLAPSYVIIVMSNHNCEGILYASCDKRREAGVFLPSRLARPAVALLLRYLSYQPWIHKPSLHTRLPLLFYRRLCWLFNYLFFYLKFSYHFLLYKVFKILFVLYNVSMVMFFIKEEENLFLLLVCFIILFLNWYCKISMQELLSGAFLFKNVICVINGRIWSWLLCVSLVWLYYLKFLHLY